MQPVDALKRYWGYDSFRPGQAEIIDSVLTGHDTIGLLPTGGGKSVTFQVPAVMLPGITVVVTPLISLMKDQVDHLRDAGIRATLLHSGMLPNEIRNAMDRCLYGRVKLVYMSPERLSRQAFLAEMRQWNVSLIVVDEAHCISQWGYDFRPSYLAINGLRKVFPSAPVLAVTASATPEVVADIAVRLDMKDPAVFSRSFSRDNLSYVIRHDDDKIGRLAAVLGNTSGPAIVYVRSRKKCSEISRELNRLGFNSLYYHAGMSKEDKELNQDRWMTGEVRIMVATNAFGMGIDKSDVRAVVHYDLPSSLEEYYQEAGRAGRDGLHSYAVMLTSKADKGVLTRRLSEAYPERKYIAHVYECLCVFLDVAVGDGFNKAFEFDMELFCHRFGLQARQALSALNLLERAGYIEYADDTWANARMMIIEQKSQLYYLDLDPLTDRIFQAIQRLYTGLFADYVDISESYIASCTDTLPEQVYQALLLLSRMHVVSYVPRRIHPYIFFPKRREETRHILIPRTIYEDQRQRLERRLESVRRFAFDSDTCRNSIILEYFGEKPQADCGRCDVCRRKRKSVRQWPDDLHAAIVDMLKARPDGTAMVDEFRSGDEAHDRHVASALEDLLEKGVIALHKSKVTLVNPTNFS